MITVEEFKNKYSDLLQVENYIDDQLKKCNLQINLMQFKNILTPEKLEILENRYKNAGWNILNLSEYVSACNCADFHSGNYWTQIKLFFEVPQ